MPARTDQAWRFSSIAALDLAPYKMGQPLSAADAPALVERSVGIENNSVAWFLPTTIFCSGMSFLKRYAKPGSFFSRSNGRSSSTRICSGNTS
jgi:hypothetical protein